MGRQGFMTIRFDEQNPLSESHNPENARSSKAGLDYSPLPRLTRYSLALAILVSMGGLIFGYDTGQISGFLEMPDFLDRFGENDPHHPGKKHFGNVRAGLIVGLLSIGTLIGTLVGALVGAPLADRLGRRISISVWALVASLGFVVQIAADRAWAQVMVGRMVTGFGVGGLSLLVPMYQAEMSPPWVRGAMVCAYQLFITLGIFLAACFNYATVRAQGSASWRIVIGLGWLWTLILGVGILAFPDTPRFVYRRGRHDEAAATLSRVYGAAPNHWAVHSQLEEIESKTRAEDSVAATTGPVAEFIGMWRAPRMAYRIALGMLLQMAQQTTGANFFFYYAVSIFRSVQLDSFVTQIIINCINFVTTFLGLYVVEHYGRRRSLIVGTLAMFACLMVFASVGHFELDVAHPERSRGPGIVLIVFACLFILAYAATWGPQVWTIQAELFPNRYRATGMALSTASNWTWNFCIGFFTPFIFGAIDFRYGYVFAGCNFAAAVGVYFFVLESRGRTLEEIDTMYLERVTPWKSESWTPPSPEDMARIRRGAGIALEDGDAADAAATGLGGGGGDGASGEEKEHREKSSTKKQDGNESDEEGRHGPTRTDSDEPVHREHA